jgi:hypothetical protein
VKERYYAQLPRVCDSLQKMCGVSSWADIRMTMPRLSEFPQQRRVLSESGGEGDIRAYPKPARAKGGGEEGIRTLDTTFAVWRFSKALPSATRPPLRCRSYDSNRPEGSNRKACAD